MSNIKTTSNEIDDRVANEYLLNPKLGMNKIGKKYGLSEDIVKRILSNKNIKILPNLDNGRKYFFNENFFTECGEIQSYFLGWIAADGHNNVANRTVCLSLHGKDIEILELFKNAIKYSGPIWNRDGGVGISLCSKNLSNSLLSIGLNHNKTSTLVFPKIPNQNLHHFMRGYFDGDGWITYSNANKNYSFGIISTDEFNLEYQRILMDLLGLAKTKLIRCSKNYSNISRLIYCGSHQVHKIGEFLYKDANFFLTRKRNRFLELNKNYE